MISPSEADEALSDYEAGRRKRHLIGFGSTVAIVALLGAGWAWWRSTGLPPRDPEIEKDVREAMDVLDTIPREHHSALAAQAMAELEANRLPPAMVEAFEKVSQVPPEMIGLIAMEPFAEDPDSQRAWGAACEAGVAAIADYARTRDIDELFARCDLGRWSLIDGTAARQLSAGRLILAHAAWGWLVEHHSESELERRVLRVFVRG
jgi:hypothetical protein